MTEDWRVTATLREPDHTSRVLEALHELQLEDDVRRRVGDRIAVSAGDSQVFLYADTEAAAREAERIVRSVLEQHKLTADLAVDRWHPLEEAWEDARAPMPQTEAERQVERERLEAQETRESSETGLALWEVRVELASHGDAVELADRLEGEGESVVRRWTFLLVGAASEDDANELARRLEREAPAGATVQVEPGGGTAWEVVGSNPFAVFGGLAG